MDIKPIETVYNGYRFRSRLEARWAVFFDAVGIKYQYEPEGYEVKYDDCTYRYLPDFYLPEQEIYVEIKSSKAALMDEKYKLGEMIDFHHTPISEKGLLVLGQIPNYQSPYTVVHFPFYDWACGVECIYANFIVSFPKAYININSINGKIGSLTGELPEPSTDDDLIKWSEEWRLLHRGIEYFPSLDCIALNGLRLIDFFNVARQARFEHGEKPRVGASA